MRKASQEPSYDNYIEQKLQGAFGYSDDQLLAEFEQAEAQPEDPDLLPPKDEWRKLLERVDDAEKKKLEEHKVLRLKRIAKPLILVAVLGAILVGTGIGASGKRGFEYLVTRIEDGKLTWDNNEDNLVDVSEAEAYQEISDVLGIEVLQLGYVPKGMKFAVLNIVEGQAEIQFKYEGEYFHFFQAIYDMENSVNTVSDGEPDISVYNKWIGKDVLIESNLLNDGRLEYSAKIQNGKSYYCIMGIMSENEIIKIIQGVTIY